ncbi:MAG: TolC family protein [Deltaproteobacteria bacterium]|nr:MAG: TolC family protein [Deltaproteobacteria bacterium]
MSEKTLKRCAAAPVALFVALCVAPGAAFAADPAPQAAGPMTPTQALDLAMKHSPSLRAAVIEAKRAKLTVTAEDERYLPTLTAGLDYTHTSSPRVTGDAVQVSSGDAVSGSVGVAQQFPWGTSIAAQLGLSGSVSKFVQPGLPAPITLGPSYGMDLNLTVTQPILRGNGRIQWESALRQARIAERAARSAEEEEASAVARNVLSAYWELWYAQEAARIQEQALTTAKRRLADAQTQVEAGARAKFDVLPLRTQVASIEEALVTAKATVATKRVALARLIGGSVGAQGVDVAPAAPAELASVPEIEDVAATAVAKSYSLVGLRAAVDQARVGADVAAERARVRLDAGAWLTVSGLGNKAVDDALAQFGGFEAVSGGVSLTLELPTDRTTVESEAATARLAVDAARAKLQDAEEQLAQSAAELVTTLDSARARVAFAQETAALAHETLLGQQDRFASGAGTATELVIAEQDEREATLRVARARVDVEAARLSLAHLTGGLLGEVETGR